MLDIVDSQTYKLQFFSKWKIHFVFYVFLLKKYHENCITTISTKIVFHDNEKQWKIKKILNVKNKTKKSRYLIKWKKFAFCENQWISKNDFDNAQNILTSFKRKRVDTITNKSTQFKKKIEKNQNRLDRIERKRVVDR